jgi:ketosteroid isomerase-like protein
MSRESVEVVRRAMAAFREGDREAAAAVLHPAIEWEPAGPGGIEPTAYRGLEEIARATAELGDVWEALRLEEADVRDLGDAVLWLGRIHLKGSASQLELDQEFAQLFTVRDGQVIRVKGFLTWREALEAAGLTE